MKIAFLAIAFVIGLINATQAATMSITVEGLGDSLANPASTTGQTGIFLGAGDPFSIEASGFVDLDGGGGGPQNDPLGTNFYGNVCPPFACGALIGRIGASGPTFFVGDTFSTTASTSGELFLFVNDIDFANNTGSFTARVTYPDPTQVVPLPAGGVLLLSALGFLALRRRIMG